MTRSQGSPPREGSRRPAGPAGRRLRSLRQVLAIQRDVTVSLLIPSSLLVSRIMPRDPGSRRQANAMITSPPWCSTMPATSSWPFRGRELADVLRRRVSAYVARRRSVSRGTPGVVRRLPPPAGDDRPQAVVMASGSTHGPDHRNQEREPTEHHGRRCDAGPALAGPADPATRQMTQGNGRNRGDPRCHRRGGRADQGQDSEPAGPREGRGDR